MFNGGDNGNEYEPEIVDDIELAVEEPDDLTKYEFINYDNEEKKYSFTAEFEERNGEKTKEVYAAKWLRDVMSRDDKYLYLGTHSSQYDDDEHLTRVRIDGDLIKHGATFGETGSGKTTFNQSLMIQLAEKGYGFTFVDPKVDDDDDGLMDSDAFELMQRIPDHRKDDVVYVTPKTIDGYSYNVNLISTPKGIDKDSDSYESIVETQSKLLVNLMRSIGDDSNWGALMGNNLKTLFNGMIRSERPYSMGDVHYLLNNPDSLEKFAEDISDELDDEFIVDSVEKLINLSDDKFDSLIRRTDQLVYNVDVRNLIFGEETDINFKEILEEDKILIIDINEPSKKIKKILMGYVSFMLYMTSKITTNREHIMFCDEFDVILNDRLIPVVDILKRGRAQNFHMWMSTQTPSTINTMDYFTDTNVQTEAKTNLGVVATGQVAQSEAKHIEEMYRAPPNKTIDAETISDPRKYHFQTQLPDTETQKAESVEMRGFPPYPPRRTKQEAFDIVRQSVKRYGSEHFSYLKYKESIRDYLINADDSLTVQEGLNIVDIATIFDEEQENTIEDGFASRDTIEQIIECTDIVELDEFDLEQWLERQCGRGRLETSKKGSDVYYSLTRDGRSNLTVSTGTSGSAGNEGHKIISQNVRKQFAEYGVYVLLELQGGDGEQPDGIGTVFDSRATRPFTKNLSVGDRFVIEVEKSTTEDKPARMMKNFRKAYDKGEFVVFVTDQKPPEKSKQTERYEKIEQIVDRSFVREITQNGKRLYNGNILESDGMYPLRKIPAPSQSGTRSSKWFISVDGESLKLMEKMSSGVLKTIANWSPVEAFENWSIEDFPAYAERTDDGYLIHDVETESTHGPFEDVKNTDKYRQVNEPWVPEIKFENVPEREDFGLFVMPTKGRRIDEPQVYYRGEFYNIGESPQSVGYDEQAKKSNQETTDKQDTEETIDGEDESNELDKNQSDSEKSDKNQSDSEKSDKNQSETGKYDEEKVDENESDDELTFFD
jgi:hypothetical protein